MSNPQYHGSVSQHVAEQYGVSSRQMHAEIEQGALLEQQRQAKHNRAWMYITTAIVAIALIVALMIFLWSTIPWVKEAQKRIDDYEQQVENSAPASPTEPTEPA